MPYKPIPNLSGILREEFDDYTMRQGLDKNEVFHLKPARVLFGMRLDDNHNVEEIRSDLRSGWHNVPIDGGEHLQEFTDDLAKLRQTNVSESQGV